MVDIHFKQSRFLRYFSEDRLFDSLVMLIQHVLFFSFIGCCCSLNVLFVSVTAAGHLTPIFELAKSMKNHNMTFLTGQSARYYIPMNDYISPSFRVVYSDSSSDAFATERKLEEDLMLLASNQSIFDAIPQIAPMFAQMMIPLLNATTSLLEQEHFDVIIYGRILSAMSVLCEKMSIPCVVQSPVPSINVFNFNLPNLFSLLKVEQLSEIPYRIYNVLFTLRMTIKIVSKLIPTVYKQYSSLPGISESFDQTFTLKNFFFSKVKCLHLISAPSTLYPPTYSDHFTKYLGPFINPTYHHSNNESSSLWIESKEENSLIYGAFGSSSIIPYDRMFDLINGLAQFLLKTDQSYLFLALRNVNYDTYETVLRDLKNKQIREMLTNENRVWIEKGFVKQKWILQQKSVQIFLSHAGMNSLLEGLYFRKTILCMPFNMEQFANAMTIENRYLGQSLFQPPSLFSSLLDPYYFIHYTFTSESVTNKLLSIWNNDRYQRETKLMSLEMKHAGGLKRAVEEIEFFVNLNGNLDRFAPFQSTLSFYQRYFIDLLFIFVLFPAILFISIKRRYLKRQTKSKKD